MSIRELGYAIFASPALSQWQAFGEQILGMASSEGPDGSLYLKMDERDYRLVIVPAAEERFVAGGWEVPNKAAFDALKSKLLGEGVEILPSDEAGLRLRRVQDYFAVKDPDGNRYEIYWGPISGFKPFISSIGLSSFVTGGLGLGHIVLPALDIEGGYQFATDKLGLGLSDILTMDFGGNEVKLYFAHCDNGRQHSLALARLPAPSGLVHMMIEVPTLKDVGMALDRVEKAGLQLVMTLGQHVNDDCVSFYFQSPTGYMVEIGWEGVVKDWSRHSVFETTLPSHWGHKFVLNDPRYQAGGGE
ncbi:VOC family protein [Sphingomonadaceae bacterium G21617-S1]|nr:VOC family protein [Sphingomonadaceae bacterium G21617-S1]